MKRWVFLFLSVVAWPVFGVDWRETLTAPQPGKFPPLRPVKAAYRFGWSGVTAAQADFDFTKVPRGQLQLSMKTQTIGAVRALWRMDTQHTALCNGTTLRPIGLQQTEIYKGETESSQVEFFPEEVRRKTTVTPLKGPQDKERRFKIPNVLDLQTGLLFVRSQRFQAGDRYRFVVYPSTSGYLAEIEVIGREKVKIAAGSYDAIKCQVRLQGISKKYELTPHKKFKRAYAWLSDDRERMLLRIEAEIFVGSVWAELLSAEFQP